MDILEEQLKAKKAGLAYALLTVAESEGTSASKIGKKMLLLEDGRHFGTIGGGELEQQALQDAARAIKEKEGFFKRYACRTEGGEACSFEVSLLVEVVSPKPQFVVCGAGHVGSAALQLAKFLNFETTLIDTRQPEQIKKALEFTDHFIPCETFEEGVLSADIAEGAYYLCCAPTHQLDKSALKGVLQKNFKYAGMVGSPRKAQEIFQQLEKEGIGRELLQQVYTPVGLDICDMSPEQVAFSILAEILMIKNGGSGRSCRDRLQ